MERYKCKLCSRAFSNGRALGGHMKSHLAASPPTTRKMKLTESQTESASSSSSLSSSVNRDDKHHHPVYVLRENPRRSNRVADPEFSFANLDHSVSSVVVLPGNEGSETESEIPNRRRSKRIKSPGLEKGKDSLKKSRSQTESAAESPMSSVSDTSPEEDLALCLVMLSRDGGAWKKRAHENIKEAKQTSVSKTSKDFKCEKCSKTFGSYRTLGRHRKICSSLGANSNQSIFKCPVCYKIFRSGQALGGHKRSHLVGPSTPSAAAATVAPTKPKSFLIDLNLPAPLDDESSSMIS